MRLTLFLGMLTCSTVAFAEKFEEISFGDNPSPKILSDSNLEVTIQSRPDSEYAETAIAAIRYPGFQPMLIELESTPNGYARAIGIGKLSASDVAPSVLFQYFSGGAHCCSTIVAAVPVGERFIKVDVGTWDGEGIEAFPRDFDGDGSSDFVMSDGAFNYAFSSYAGSWALHR